MDYVNGLKMYEAIVEEKILETAQNQIKKLEKISEELMVDDKVPEPAEVQELKETVKNAELKPLESKTLDSDKSLEPCQE